MKNEDTQDPYLDYYKELFSPAENEDYIEEDYTDECE